MPSITKEDTKEFIVLFETLLKKLSERGLKNPAGVVAQLGEFLTYSHVLEMDAGAVLQSGQSGVDILLSNGKRIEVKTASYNGALNLWGFGRIKPVNFDYLVCVALNSEYDEEPDFLIFTKREADNLPSQKESGSRRFKSNLEDRTFHKFGPNYRTKKTIEKLVIVNNNLEKYRDWNKIKF